MSWLYYLLEANLYLAIFYLLYRWVLRHDTHYQLNRAYLLLSSMIALLLPLLQLGFLKHNSAMPPPPPPVAPFVDMMGNAVAKQTVAMAEKPLWSADNYGLLLYGIIAGVLLLNFSLKLYKLIRLSKLSRTVSGQPFKLVELPDQNNAFSFFNYLFADPKLSASATIINHELVHIRQRHSLDIVYLEILKIFNWFNPAIYLLQHSIKELHEFIADQETTITNKLDVGLYTDFLINNAYGMPETSLTNNLFNDNLLKRRIIMLHQKRSGNLARLKYLGAIPLFTGMLCASTLGFTKDYGWIDLAPAKQIADSTLKLPPPPPPAPPKSGKMIKLAPPTIINAPFRVLADYLYWKTKYPAAAAKAQLNGVLAADFKVDANGKIGSVAISKGAGHGFDEAALKALQTYHSAVDFKPGDYRIGINFMMQSSKSVPQTPGSFKQHSNFIGEVIVMDQIPNEKQKQLLAPPPPPPTPQAKMGKIAPPADRAEKLPPPPPPPVAPAEPFGALYQHIQQTIQYPQEAIDQQIEGPAIASFTVNDKKMMQQLHLMKGRSPVLNNALSQSLQNTGVLNDAKPGITYTISVYFVLKNPKDTSSLMQGATKPNFMFKVPKNVIANYISLNRVNVYGMKKAE